MLASRGPRPDHAVVIGASLSGLCVARVLSQHFQRVTLIEADALPSEPVGRKGVPQSPFPHTLLLRGFQALSELFPGFEARLASRGAGTLDIAADWARYTEKGWVESYELGYRLVAATRPLIEHTVRELFRELCDNATIVDCTRVVGLDVEAGKPARVRGVRTDHADPALASIAAELVVDCSGRGSRSLKLLAEHGIEAPPRQRVAAYVGYSSRLYRVPEGSEPSWWKGILVHEAFPEHPGFGILAPVEKGLWLVTAGGYNRSYPPSDDAEFVAFLRGLRSPVIAEAIAAAEPITPISHTRATDNLWNEAHRWPAAPRGFLLMGDALCAPNPAHGQGITKASVEALILGEHLARRSRDFEPAFRRAQARWAQRIWNVATLLDLRWSNAEGPRPWYLGAVQWASKLMLHASHLDRAVFKVSAGVYQFVLPDLALVKPGILARVVFALLRSAPRLPPGHAETVPSLTPEAQR